MTGVEWQEAEEAKYIKVGFLSWRKELKFEDLPRWKQTEALRIQKMEANRKLQRESRQYIERAA